MSIENPKGSGSEVHETFNTLGELAKGITIEQEQAAWDLLIRNTEMIVASIGDRSKAYQLTTIALNNAEVIEKMYAHPERVLQLQEILSQLRKQIEMMVGKSGVQSAGRTLN
jgi:hypothetical protein